MVEKAIQLEKTTASSGTLLLPTSSMSHLPTTSQPMDTQHSIYPTTQLSSFTTTSPIPMSTLPVMNTSFGQHDSNTTQQYHTGHKENRAFYRERIEQ